jgi:hypothetical protein
MHKIPLIGTVLGSLVLLAGCVDVGDQPSYGGRPGYERAIDQDISASHENGAILQDESPATPANWRY